MNRDDLPRLRQQVHDSRIRLSREYAGLVDDLDVPKRFARSVRSHPLGWAGGAAAAGLLLSLFGRGSGRSKGVPTRHATRTNTAGRSGVSEESHPSAPLITRAGLLAGALQIARLLYPVLRPALLEFAGKAARSGLDRIRRR